MCILRTLHQICHHFSTSPFHTTGNRLLCGILECHNILHTVKIDTYCPTCRQNRRWHLNVEHERGTLEQNGEIMTLYHRRRFLERLDQARLRIISKGRREMWNLALMNRYNDYVAELTLNYVDYTKAEVDRMRSYVMEYWTYAVDGNNPETAASEEEDGEDDADSGIEEDEEDAVCEEDSLDTNDAQELEGSVLVDIDDHYFGNTPLDPGVDHLIDPILQPLEPRRALSTLYDSPQDDNPTNPANSHPSYSISIGDDAPITVYITSDEHQAPSLSSSENYVGVAEGNNLSDQTAIPRSLSTFGVELEELINDRFGALTNWCDEHEDG